jgi:hypothetical protein
LQSFLAHSDGQRVHSFFLSVRTGWGRASLLRTQEWIRLATRRKEDPNEPKFCSPQKQRNLTFGDTESPRKGWNGRVRQNPGDQSRALNAWASLSALFQFHEHLARNFLKGLKYALTLEGD